MESVIETVVSEHVERSLTVRPRVRGRACGSPRSSAAISWFAPETATAEGLAVRRVVAGALSFAALIALGCGPDLGPERPHLLLVSIDTLRPDHLGLHGYPFDTSPELDRRAGSAFVFENAFSTSSWTLPAHASMLTGLFPHEHQVEREDAALAAEIETLPELLREFGYRSEAIVSVVPFLTRRYGFDQGFEFYDDQTAYPSASPETPHSASGWATFVSSPLVHRQAVEVLAKLGSEPTFLFLHYFDAHAAYRAPKRFRELVAQPRSGAALSRDRVSLPAHHEHFRARAEELAALYDAEIRWVDHWIGELFRELERRSLLERTVVILTSDHGEEFYEHGELRHRNNLFDATLRVPLLVWAPEGFGVAGRIASPVSLVDVPATLLAAATGRSARLHSGVDLLNPSLRRSSAGPARDLFAAMVSWGSERIDSALIRGNRKALFRAPYSSPEQRAVLGWYRSEFGRLEAIDPREDSTVGVAEARVRLEAEVRRAELARARTRGGDRVVLTEQERLALRSLGYL